MFSVHVNLKFMSPSSSCQPVFQSKELNKVNIKYIRYTSIPNTEVHVNLNLSLTFNVNVQLGIMSASYSADVVDFVYTHPAHQVGLPYL